MLALGWKKRALAEPTAPMPARFRAMVWVEAQRLWYEFHEFLRKERAILKKKLDQRTSELKNSVGGGTRILREGLNDENTCDKHNPS